MKKLIIASALTICSSIIVSAQSTAYKKECNFLTDLKFKNGVDTIFVLGFKTQSVRNGPPAKSLTELNNQKRISRYKFRYGIAFKPLNCFHEIIADCCTDTSAFAFNINQSNYNKIVRMRCIVFEGYFEFARPYFIVDQITPYEK